MKTKINIISTPRSQGKSIWQQMYEEHVKMKPYTLYYTTGTVYGELYYCVQMYGNYSWEEMCSWCSQVFGEETPRNFVPDKRWYPAHHNSFWFKNESDKLMFMLKWGN